MRIPAAVMWVGTVVLLAGLAVVMAYEPFEYVDDLAWLNKVSGEPWANIPLGRAWMDESPFYRPGAELLLKLLYSAFGLHLLPYRIVQFGALLGLIGVSAQLVLRLRLPLVTAPLMIVFLIGSPFTSGSIVWLSELPHVIILICFAAGSTILLSDRSDTAKLTYCVSLFAIALSMKENGLALLIFYPFLARSIPIRATVAFGTIAAAYFLLRATTMGGGMGLANAEPVDAHAYVINVLSQVAALWTRLTKWGEPVQEFSSETVIVLASSTLIVLGLTRARGWPRLVFLGVAFGCALFSYAYARDRHLALPAYAYGVLLLMAVDALSSRWRWLLVCAWLAWSAQAALSIRGIHRASVDLIEKIYRPNPEPLAKGLPQAVWTSARDAALRLR